MVTWSRSCREAICCCSTTDDEGRQPFVVSDFPRPSSSRSSNLSLKKSDADVRDRVQTPSKNRNRRSKKSFEIGKNVLLAHDRSRKARRRCRCLCGLIGMTLGLVVFMQAFLLPLLIKQMLEDKVKSAILITDETELDSIKYKNWVNNNNPDAPTVISKYWFCNITNTQQVLAGGIPYFNLVGPYTYKKVTKKLDVEFFNNGSSVRYIPMQYYIFLPNQSCAGCDDTRDMVTVINPVLFTLFSFLPGLSLIQRWYFTGLLKQINFTYLWVRRPPIEMLFGYEDPVLVKLKNDPLTGGSIPLTVVTLFRNDSSEAAAKESVGFDTVLTGKNTISEAGFYTGWNNRTFVEYWDPPLKVSGYGMTQYPPLAVPESFGMWTPSLFRDLPFYNSGKSVNYFGISGRRYLVNETTILNSSSYPPNSQFYQNGVNGLFNLTSPPPKTVPIFITWRHFSGAPELAVLNSEMNLPEPDPSVDEAYIDIELTSGAAIGGSKPAQINVPTGPGPDGTAWSAVQSLTFPMVILDEGAQLTEDLASKFDQIFFASNVSTSSRWWGLILGPFIVLIVVALLFCGYNRRNPDRRYRLRKKKEAAKVWTTRTKRGMISTHHKLGEEDKSSFSAIDENLIIRDPLSETGPYSTGPYSTTENSGNPTEQVSTSAT